MHQLKLNIQYQVGYVSIQVTEKNDKILDTQYHDIITEMETVCQPNSNGEGASWLLSYRRDGIGKNIGMYVKAPQHKLSGTKLCA